MAGGRPPLGGVRACQYASQPGVVGLVLFGSYCINDVSVPTISLRGSNDQLTTQHDVDNAKAKLKNARYVSSMAPITLRLATMACNRAMAR